MSEIESLTIPDGSSIENVDFLGAATVSHTVLDARGRLVQNLGQDLQITITHSMNNNLRLEEITMPDGVNTMERWFDGDRIVKAVDAAGISTEYEYDAAGRQTLIREQRTDSQGNAIITRQRYNAKGELIARENHLGEITRYQYDDAGNQTLIEFPDGRKQRARYDKVRRLIAVSGANTYSITYAYDALGRQIKLSDGNGKETHFYYDALGRLTERPITATMSKVRI